MNYAIYVHPSILGKHITAVVKGTPGIDILDIEDDISSVVYTSLCVPATDTVAVVSRPTKLCCGLPIIPPFSSSSSAMAAINVLDSRHQYTVEPQIRDPLR